MPKRTERGGGVSTPPFPHRYSGPCIVAGNAFCLHDDLAYVRELLPDAPVIAVNGASKEVKAIALYSSHPERMVARGFEWIRHQTRLFGPGFTVHGSAYVISCTHVEHWWEDARGDGGSAWGARKLAWLMGFDPVILCGCPLVAGNYADHSPSRIMNRDHIIDGLRQGIVDEPEWHDGCVSASGWTKEFLGGC